MSALAAIQTAIYSTLSSDVTLTGLASVTGDVDENTSYPFVLVGNANEKPWHTMGGPSVGLGYNDIIRVHIYSDYEGDLEALSILNRVVALLNYQALSVSGYTTAIVEYVNGRVLTETNKDKIEIRHIPAEFRVRVHQ